MSLQNHITTVSGPSRAGRGTTTVHRTTDPTSTHPCPVSAQEIIPALSVEPQAMTLAGTPCRHSDRSAVSMAAQSADERSAAMLAPAAGRPDRAVRRADDQRRRAGERVLRRRQRSSSDHEAGMATAEYAIATLAAVGFAALLVAVLSSGEIKGLLMSLITSALNFG
jgi:hypothetical protein